MFGGESNVMRELLAGVDKVAEAPDTTVLIEGEPGTGKAWLARLIHRKTPGRARHPLVAIPLGALAEAELEGELLGQEGPRNDGIGAARPGALELAEGGTLLLEEVAELTLGNQDMVLELLARGAFKRIGGKRDIIRNNRLIATTSKDLSILHEAGAFRRGLFHRLSTFHIRIPSLRDRPEDIVPYARYFVAGFGRRIGRPSLSLSVEAERTLSEYPFPGNLRELKLLVESASVKADADVIQSQFIVLPKDPDQPRPFFSVALNAQGSPPPLRHIKRGYMEKVLEYTKGNRAGAARVLQISLPTLVRKE